MRSKLFYLFLVLLAAYGVVFGLQSAIALLIGCGLGQLVWLLILNGLSWLQRRKALHRRSEELVENPFMRNFASESVYRTDCKYYFGDPYLKCAVGDRCSGCKSFEKVGQKNGDR